MVWFADYFGKAFTTPYCISKVKKLIKKLMKEIHVTAQEISNIQRENLFIKGIVDLPD